MEAALFTTPRPSAALVPDAAPLSRARRRAGVALTGLTTAFLLFDAAMKIAAVPPVIEAMRKTGFPEATARPIGLTLLGCLVLYLIPRTAILGMVLLTGYLGGAVVTQVRLQTPLFSYVLVPVYLGIVMWVGLALRDDRLRSLLSPRGPR